MQEPPFRAGAGRARPWPFQGSKKSGKASSSTSTRQRWWVPGGGSPGRLCPALAESAGQLPGHRHRRGRGGHCIPATASAHPLKHQFPDQEQPSSASRRCLADEGSQRAGHQRDVPRILQSVVPGAQEDRRSATCNRPVHSQPPHGSSTLQDGDARVRPISHQKSGVDGIDRHTRCLPSCSDASGYQQVSAFHGQQEGVLVHLSSVWTGDLSTRVPQAAATRRFAVKAGVKLHVYLDYWLIRADTPEQVQLHAQTTIRVLQFLGWIINFEKFDLTPSQDFQFIGMQFNTRRFTVAPLPNMRLKVQSVHQHWMTNPNITARDLHRLLGMLVFMASLVRRGQLRLRPVQWWAATAWCQRTGNWSDRIQVPQWVLSEVAWWSSPAVLQGLPLVTKETEVTLFTDVSSSGWGAQLGSRSTQGQWSASQWSCHINVLEMQAVIYTVRDFLPHLRSRVVRLNCATTQWRWRTSRTRGARDRPLWCRWPYDCSSGATARRLRWFPSICQECTTSRRIPCPESARHWPRSGQWPWRVYDLCLPSGASHGSTCLRHSPTDDSSSLYRRIRTPGQSGQMPCPCRGTRRGAFFTLSRHSRWSLKYCRRSLSHQEWRWFWSLNCNQQHRGSLSWWTSPKKIQFFCSSKV